MRLIHIFARQRPDIDELAARCAATERLVAARVAAVARAAERHIAGPDTETFAALEDAEQLLFLAEYEQRRAREALQRAVRRRRFQRHARGGPRTTGSAP